MSWKIIIAMVCVTSVLITALLLGHNGVLMASGISAITGLAGYGVGRATKPKDQP